MNNYLLNPSKYRSVYQSKVLILAVAGVIIAITSLPSYSEEGGEFLLFEPEDIANWTSSIAAGDAKLTEDVLVLISGKGGWGGGVASPWLAVDFAKSPVITIKVHKVSNNWVMKLGLYHQDNQWGPYIQGDTNKIGEFSYNLPDDLHSFPAGVNPPDPKKTEEGQIRVWGTGVQPWQVWVENVKMFYQNDLSDRPRFVDPELEKAYIAKHFPVAPCGKLSTLWGLIKKR